MFNEPGGILKVVLSVLLFPLFFQNYFIVYVWGADETLWVMAGNRIFL